jgi:chloramphenicol-sensitive protein RarD
VDARLRQGILAGLGAYAVWGTVPVFFKQLGSVPPLEIIAHRVLWSMLLMAAVLSFGSGWHQVQAALRAPRMLARVTLGAVLVMSNWLIFVYGISIGQIVATSLGYFMLPLLNVALGVLVLGERLRRWQWWAVACAVTGVLLETWRVGGLPWISLALAATFGLYGLLRKQLAMDSASGLFLETLTMTLPAAGYLLWLQLDGSGQFGRALTIDWLLVASGAVTAIPLLLFAIAARRLPLNTMGFLQYLAPTISLTIAVVIYHEEFDLHRAAGFVAIWIGIAVYSVDLWRHTRTS